MSDISSVVVIIPSLNPDEKLNMVVDGAINEGFTHLVLVNDGSDENHVARFEEAAKHPEVTVLTHVLAGTVLIFADDILALTLDDIGRREQLHRIQYLTKLTGDGRLACTRITRQNDV